MKKLLALLLVAAMIFSFAACSPEKTKDADKAPEKTVPDEVEGMSMDDFMIGFIFLHDENSTYDKNFLDAAKAATKAAGIPDEQVLIKTNIPESEDCYEAAKELVNAGCDLVFADSFGHEPYMIQAAKEFPDVQFCHATGTRAHTEGVSNYHNAFASIYEGRFLAGVAAGMKLNEMIAAGEFTEEEAKIGYVGAFPYAEVISGYTSFYLGVKYICPSVTMEVQYTNSWFDITAENNAAKALIASGCKLISQHADSSGAPTACEDAGVPNVAYNIDTSDLGPTTAIISSKINWEPYFAYIIGVMLEGGSIDADWTGTLATDSVQLTKLNEAVAAEGTAEKIEEVKGLISSGELKVFDTSTFTVNGEELTTYLADVVDAGDYVGETEAVSDGCFNESTYRSAPYFNIIIDGITVPEA
ncbi:MAG: BMP family ABC transporter substrate-binding protein [Ruminococcaceae bacterium]|nr:BMP family ABC transporter substrate-binding protein [Oscillospiraceae bacterium]